jgi:hypothetical protein
MASDGRISTHETALKKSFGGSFKKKFLGGDMTS